MPEHGSGAIGKASGVDLNSADEQELERVGGLGRERARRIIEEGEEALKMGQEENVKDAALIGSAQRVEHYEIAGYGCLKTYAHLLGNRQAASLAEKTLEEEKQTDKKLTKIAESMVNPKAAGSGEESTATRRKVA